MQPFAADVLLTEVRGQIFGQPFRKSGDQHTLTLRGSQANFFQQVRHLISRWRDFNYRIEQARGPNHLLDSFALGLAQFHTAPAWPIHTRLA